MEDIKVIRVAQVVGRMIGGGVEAMTVNYYSGMDHTKIQYDFIVSEDSTQIPRKIIEGFGGRVFIVPPHTRPWRYIPALIRLYKENKWNIVHSHINTMSVFPLYAAWRSGIPVRIAHSHSTAGGREWIRNAFKFILKRPSRIFATHYFACSEHAGRWQFGNRAFDAGRVALIRNAIFTEDFVFDKQIRKETRTALDVRDNFCILHVGRFNNPKNHAFLIEIFAAILKKQQACVLLLVGEGPLDDEISAKVKRLGIEKRVLFLGTRNDVPRLMQAADLFLLPSHYEGLPVVSVEAQAAALQMIASKHVSAEACLTKYMEFIDLDAGAEAWATAALRHASGYPRGCEIKTIAEAGYDMKTAAKELEEIYLQLNAQLTRE